jgi:hypothetical protein
VEVVFLFPFELTVELLRKAIAAARESSASWRAIEETLTLFPRVVVAAERIAALAPEIETLASMQPDIACLAGAMPAIERLAAATSPLDQMERLANATVVGPIQGTAERVGRFVDRLPGNPRRTAPLGAVSDDAQAEAHRVVSLGG